MSEKELVQRAKQGSKEAFCDLYSLYKDRLYKYAFYKLGNPDDAQDAVSETVLSAFRQISSLKRAQAFPAWIFKILNSYCSQYIKNQISSREMLNLESIENRVCLQEKYSISVELSFALDRLEDDERDIVLLCVVAGFKSREAAQLLGMTAGSVRSKLSRSLDKMRKYLE